MGADVVTFLGIVVVLSVTPGADMALVMRNVLGHGFRAVWPTMAGIFCGLLVHASMSVAGLSVVLRDSETAFTVVKLVGAGWLAWMGVGALLEAWRAGRVAPAGSAVPAGSDALQRADATDAESTARPAMSAVATRALFVRGFLTNLLNVKIALFYIAFLPQFAPAGDRFVPVALGLALAQMAIGMAWITIYAALVARAGAAIQGSPRARRWLEGSTGAALIGFGVRLATASR
jgi:threonine/homoserine/homoserine lactone efflux protein